MGIDAEMYVEVSDKVTPNEVLVVSRRLVDAVGPDKFWLRDEFSDYMHAIPAKGQTMPHALYMVTHETWDSNQNDGVITRPPGKAFVKVSLGSRFYGKGYERGPIDDQLTVARFLKAAWPDGKVFYGGDSSGVAFEEVTPAWEKDILRHFHAVGHTPYRGGFDNPLMDQPRPGEKAVQRPKPCPRCLTSMTRNGWGVGFGAFFCGSCNLTLETHDNGQTFVNRRDKRNAAARAVRERLEAMEDTELLKLYFDSQES